MKKIFVIFVIIILSACAVDPNTGLNPVGKAGFLMQCMGNGFCPPLPREGYAAQAAYQQNVLLKEQNDILKQSKNLNEAVSSGSKVYSYDECVGSVVMGKCHGSIVPKSAYHPTCHGEWINGACTGPVL